MTVGHSDMHTYVSKNLCLARFRHICVHYFGYAFHMYLFIWPLYFCVVWFCSAVLALVFQYQIKKLAEKNVSKMTHFVLSSGAWILTCNLLCIVGGVGGTSNSDGAVHSNPGTAPLPHVGYQGSRRTAHRGRGTYRGRGSHLRPPVWNAPTFQYLQFGNCISLLLYNASLWYEYRYF